ncbi:hypothetical protein EDD21DRAFT_416972 [Dissophora ornata]|nr:hypothetical protein EDD21DRAFT_416972 [Dissophora ornata]
MLAYFSVRLGQPAGNASALRTRTFVELSEPICDFMNEDWEFRRQCRYACAQILAGSALLNCNNGQAVMANTVEVYGKTRSIDAHREPFTVKKGFAIPTSLPSSSNGRHKDVWPLTITAQDGSRLVIGTQSCNALITSSIRLDLSEQISVGGTTLSFVLSTAEASNATRIFLDKESVNAALAFVVNEKAWSISNRNLLIQLRQLKTKFHDPSTYLTGHSGNGTTAGAIFRFISREVLRNGTNAALERGAVREYKAQCTTHDQISVAFDAILGLFPTDTTSIPILGNLHLNKELENLANLMSSYIATANKSVVAYIQQSFSESNT